MRADEIRDLPNEELAIRLEEFKEELFNLRFQLATGQLENYKRVGGVGRDIARIETVIRERNLGIEPEPDVLEARKRSRDERVRKAEEQASEEDEEASQDAEEGEEAEEAEGAPSGEEVTRRPRRRLRRSKEPVEAVAEETSAESEDEKE